MANSHRRAVCMGSYPNLRNGQCLCQLHVSSPHPYVLFQICLPESPRYLLLKGRTDAARVALGRLMTLPANSEEVDKECRDISDALAVEMTNSSGSYRDCFRNNKDRNGFRTWTGIMLQGWQQLTGINFICMFLFILLC